MGWWRIDLAAFAADRRPREIIARRRGFPIFLALNHAALMQRLRHAR